MLHYHYLKIVLCEIVFHFRYTMTKSTTIVFILGFAILFKLEKKVPMN